MRNKYFINTLVCFVTLIFSLALVSPFLVEAQGGDPTGGGGNPTGQPTGQSSRIVVKIDNPFKKDTIRGLIETIIDDILIPIGAVVAVLMVMYAGFLFVTARGNTEQIERAKKALLWAVIGAAILLGAKIISQAIQGTIDELRN